MKKLFAMLLAIAMVLSMAACGGEQEAKEDTKATKTNTQTEENNAKEETLPAEPSAEDWVAIDQYRAITNALNEYEEQGYLSIEYADLGMENEEEYASDMEALVLCYDQLTKLEAVDKWVGSDYIDAQLQRQKYLDKFTLVEDVLLSHQTYQKDYLGNQTGSNEYTYSYYPDGKLYAGFASTLITGSQQPWLIRDLSVQIESNPGQVAAGTPFLKYDENGRLEKIEYAYFDGDAINALATYTYTGDNITAQQIISADGTEQNVSYTYNDQGQLVEMSTVMGYVRNRLKYTYSYTYNDQGQVLTEVVLVEQEDYYNEGTYQFYNQIKTDYTYDSNHFLASAVVEYTQNWDNGKAIETDHITYTCEQQGRVVSLEIACGPLVLQETGETLYEAEFATFTAQYNYGTYYIYSAEA